MTVVLKIFIDDKTKHKIKKVFNWYDYASKKMLQLEGDELRFKYDPTLKRSVPYAIDNKSEYKNNYNEILFIIDEYDLEIEQFIPNKYVIVEFDDKILADLELSLRSRKIRFVYNTEDSQIWRNFGSRSLKHQ